MQKIRDLLGRRSSKREPSDSAHARHAYATSTSTRALHVANLHADVSRLQQEILALSDAAQGETDPKARAESEAKMIRLGRELDLAQQEASKFQARI